MAKARALKSASSKLSNEKWEQGILSALPEDNDWRFMLGFIVGNSAMDDLLLDALEYSIRSGIRCGFSIISKEELIAKVRTASVAKGAAKKGKADKDNVDGLFADVFEAARPVLDAEGGLTAKMLAFLVKARVMQIRAGDLRRRELKKLLHPESDEDEGEEEEEEEIQEAAGKGKAKKGAKAPPKPKEKEKKGQKVDASSTIKKESALKRRGEEGDDMETLDDEPSDGPEQYILLRGFTDAAVISCLEEVGVRTDSILNVRADDDSLLPSAPQKLDGISAEDLGITAEEYQSRVSQFQSWEQKQKETGKFWEDLKALLTCADNPKLKDLVPLSVTLSAFHWKEANMEALTVAKKKETPAEIEKRNLETQNLFDDLAHALYTLVSYRRQHVNYLNTIKLYQVAEEPTGPPTVDMRYYNDLMDTVPPESVSSALVLHCMLEQLEATETGKEPPNGRRAPTQDEGLQNILSHYLSKKVNKLAIDQQEAKELYDALQGDTPMGNASRMPGQPVLIPYRDHISKRLEFLQDATELKPKEAEMHMNELLQPWASLLPLPSMPNHERHLRAARLHEVFLRCIEITPQPEEFDLAFKLLFIEYLQLSRVDKSGRIVPPPESPNVWDDPYLCPPVAPARKSARPKSSGRASRATFADESREGRRSILKNPRPISRADSAPAVRFEDGQLPDRDPEGPSSPPAPKLSAALRSMDEFVIMEHLEPHVLAQALQEASTTRACLDTFYHKRDHSLFVVLHNPFDAQLRNNADWNVRLLSDVGLRNFTNHIANLVKEWMRDENAHYAANSLKKEIDQLDKEAVETKKRESRSRSTSAKRKKSPEPVAKTDSTLTDDFIRKGGLKAQRIEEEKLRAEQEEKARLKAGRKSVGKGKDTHKEAKADDKKPGSRSQSRSGSPKKGRQTEKKPEEAPPPTAPAPAPLPPFEGYTTGDMLVHVDGHCTMLFPTDGGQIRVETIHFTSGRHLVHATAFRDGHMLTAHVIYSTLFDPATVPQKTTQNVRLVDGMQLSTAVIEPERRVVEEPPPPPPTAPAPVVEKKKDEDKKKRSKSQAKEPEVVEVVQAPPPPPPPEIPPPPPFQQLCVICPDGLQVTTLNESLVGIETPPASGGKLLIAQAYSVTDKNADPVRAATALHEVKRLYFTDGTVTKLMRDGSAVVLGADGSVAKSQDVFSAQKEAQMSMGDRAAHENSAVGGKKKKKTAPSPMQETQSISEEHGVSPTKSRSRPVWEKTTADGRLLVTSAEGNIEERGKLLTSKATDPESAECLFSRQDRVVIVYRSQERIVQHSDGTRITTCVEAAEKQFASEQHKETGEALPCSRMKITSVKVECPGFATVVFQGEEARLVFGSGTVVEASPSGEYQVHHTNGGHLSFRTSGGLLYQPQSNDSSPEDEHVGVILVDCRADTVIETVDHTGNVFSVDRYGGTSVQGTKDEHSLSLARSHNVPRFFVVYEDGSGAELMRYEDVGGFLDVAELDPRTAVIRQPLPSYPSAVGITVLRPYEGRPSDMWLRRHESENIVPKNLRAHGQQTLFKQNAPSRMVMLAGGSMFPAPAFSVPSCPAKLELRRFLQFAPMTATLRERLQAAMRGYEEAATKKQSEDEFYLVRDGRSTEEQERAAGLFHKARPYGLLQNELPLAYEHALVPSAGGDASSGNKLKQRRMTSAERRREDRDKHLEEEYRLIIREKRFPAYFQSELGQAFLLNQAVTKRPSQLKPQLTASLTSPPRERKALPPPVRLSAPQAGRLDKPADAALKSSSERVPTESSSRRKASPLRVSVKAETALAAEPSGQASPPRSKGRLPAFYTNAGRPGAILNAKFAEIEEPVRGRVKTTSIAGATYKGTAELHTMRGCQLFPTEVHFGTLREGCTYERTVLLHNTGQEGCRFAIRQPQPGTGLRVTFQPGVVAAGMSRHLHLELFAVASSPSGTTERQWNVEIVTENHHLLLPVDAKVAVAAAFDRQYSGGPDAAVAGGVRMVSLRDCDLPASKVIFVIGSPEARDDYGQRLAKELGLNHIDAYHLMVDMGDSTPKAMQLLRESILKGHAAAAGCIVEGCPLTLVQALQFESDIAPPQLVLHLDDSTEEAQLSQVLQYYLDQGLLRKINATADPQMVFAEALQVLEPVLTAGDSL